MDNEYTVIGKPRPIGDAALKVTGQKIYVGDMELPGMLYAKVLLSTVPHARIKSIDTSAAEALPGVKRGVRCQPGTLEPGYRGPFVSAGKPDQGRR